MDEAERLTEGGLLQRRSAFVGEIQELEDALDSVVNDRDKAASADVVTEISNAVEKSRYVLRDLEDAIATYRAAKAARRRFTEDEEAVFRFFGFDASGVTFEAAGATMASRSASGGSAGAPAPRVAKPHSPRSHTAAQSHSSSATSQHGAVTRSANSSPSERETETNVFDAYKTRPSPEALAEGMGGLGLPKSVSASKSPSPPGWASGDVVQKMNMEALIQAEVESRLGNLMLAAETELETRSRRMLDERMQELEKRMPLAGTKPSFVRAAVEAEVQTDAAASDFADLFGMDSPDDLEEKLNEMVQQRLQVERARLAAATAAASPGSPETPAPANEGLRRAVAELTRENEELRDRVHRLEEQCNQQRVELAAARAASPPASNPEAAQNAAQFAEAVGRLEGTMDELKSAATSASHILQEKASARTDALDRLQGLVDVKARDEIAFLKNQLQAARETYRSEIAALGGHLEGNLVDSAEVSQLLGDTQRRLSSIAAELTPKVYDYTPPTVAAKQAAADAVGGSPAGGSQGPPDTTDLAVAKVLKNIKCPVPIDCHKVAPGEYFLDRRVRLKLVDGVPCVVRRHADAPPLPLEQYIRRLYLPFLHGFDLARAEREGKLPPSYLLDNPVGIPHIDFEREMEVYAQYAAGEHPRAGDGDVPPFDESSMREFRKLRGQQQELIRQLRHTAPAPAHTDTLRHHAAAPAPYEAATPAGAFQASTPHAGAGGAHGDHAQGGGTRRGHPPPFVAQAAAAAAAGSAGYADIHNRRAQAAGGEPPPPPPPTGYTGQPMPGGEEGAEAPLGADGLVPVLTQRGGAGALPAHPAHVRAGGYSQEEQGLLRDFFDLIDRGGVGLVSKSQMLRSLRRHSEVASKLRVLTHTTLPGQLEEAIEMLPGGDRELPWDAFYTLFVDIRQQHYRDPLTPHAPPPLQRAAAQQPHTPAHGHPSSISESAKAFNERIQARQREMTRELLDSNPAAVPSTQRPARSPSQSARGRTPLKQVTTPTSGVPLGGDRMTKSHMLRAQATEARRNRKPMAF